MQCKIHNPAAITDRISWTEEIGNLYSPSPPPRQLRIGKWHILAFAQLHPRLFGGVWGGEAVGLLSHFILSKIAVKITVRGRVCTCK